MSSEVIHNRIAMLRAERIPSPSQYIGKTCPVHCRNTGRCVTG